jgi:Fe-S-cluster containining protein
MCCKVLRVETPTPDHVRWLEGRAVETSADETGAYAFVPCVCRHLTGDGKCGIQDSKPVFCALAPVGGEMCRQVLRKFRPDLLARLK